MNRSKNLLRSLALCALLTLSACRLGESGMNVSSPPSCPPSGAVGVPPSSIVADNRSSILYAPANYQPGVAYPLLVSLHPFVTDPALWEAYSGLAAAASARGYWVLVPRGSDPGPRWSVPGGSIDGTDLSWIDHLVTSTTSSVCVDSRRIFAAGFSAGAAMAVGLSCELPQRFRAIAASGGANLTSLCPSAGPTDALILHGSVDPIAPVTGSYIIFAPPLGVTVDSVVANFVTRNGCNATPDNRGISPTVVDEHYSCGSHRLDYWRMNGAGHTWAGASFPLDLITGPTDHSFSANTAVLDFFDGS